MVFDLFYIAVRVFSQPTYELLRGLDGYLTKRYNYSSSHDKMIPEYVKLTVHYLLSPLTGDFIWILILGDEFMSL